MKILPGGARVTKKKVKRFLALSVLKAPARKQQVMGDVLIEQNTNATDEIPLGGRPGNFEKYYDAKTGWLLNPNGGNKYLVALARLKVILLSARSATTRREVDAALQEASKIVLEVLGEVDPDEGQK